MKIVVLDGGTLNPGDLSWNGLTSLGVCEIHDRSTPEEVVARATGADALFVNKVAITREVLDRLPGLRYIGVLATGYNVVDVEAARERGVTVANVPEYGTDSVAQMVFAHILNLTQRVAEHAESVRRGDWSRSSDFCYWRFPLVELSGRVLGIVGCGRIGQRVAAIGRAFGMTVVGHSRRPAPDMTMLPLDNLFARSDVVSLHCPLTEETRGLVDARRLSLMKPTAFLVNTGRGALIDEAALAEALRAGRLAGAGLDVATREPPAPDHPLPAAPNCYLTPHIAWATLDARRRLLETAVDNLRAFLAGHPVNRV